MGIVVLAALAGAAPAAAELGATDNVPAATLLFPYFEVDLGNLQGVNTLIAIQNASASAGLMNVTLWTDLGIPTFSFNVYFTGFDTQTFNLRDILVNGNIPVTASAGQDQIPDDVISPQGPLSQDINFASCNLDPDDFGAGDDGPLGPFMPAANPVLTAAQIADLQAAHRGLASTAGSFGIAVGQCAARPLGDNIARGYVTADDINQCTTLNPRSPSGYFPPNSGATGTRNIWQGDVFYVRPGANLMEADIAVPVEATFQTVPFQYTFYGRMPGVNFTGSDRREPLATAWAASYLNFATDLVVWRDPTTDVAPFPCGSPAGDPYPLQQTQVVAFDTEENPLPLSGALFPAAAQRIPVGPPPMSIPGEKAGWLFLNLNSSTGFMGAFRQSWVQVLRNPEPPPIMSTGWSAVRLGSAATGDNPTVGPPP